MAFETWATESTLTTPITVEDAFNGKANLDSNDEIIKSINLSKGLDDDKNERIESRFV